MLVPLYARGMAFAASRGASLFYAPMNTPPAKTVSVTVENVSFVIARAMVMPRENDAQEAIPLAKNFFAMAFAGDRDAIAIDDDHYDDVLGQAKYYPAVFDYLQRRMDRTGRRCRRMLRI